MFPLALSPSLPPSRPAIPGIMVLFRLSHCVNIVETNCACCAMQLESVRAVRMKQEREREVVSRERAFRGSRGLLERAEDKS